MFQVADVYIGLDVMSSQMDVRVPNFRKLNLKGFSVYGMAQPARDVSQHSWRSFGQCAMCLGQIVLILNKEYFYSWIVLRPHRMEKGLDME